MHRNTSKGKFNKRTNKRIQKNLRKKYFPKSFGFFYRFCAYKETIDFYGCYYGDNAFGNNKGNKVVFILKENYISFEEENSRNTFNALDSKIKMQHYIQLYKICKVFHDAGYVHLNINPSNIKLTIIKESDYQLRIRDAKNADEINYQLKIGGFNLMEPIDTLVTRFGLHKFMCSDLIIANTTKIQAITKFDIYSLTAVMLFLKYGIKLPDDLFNKLSDDSFTDDDEKKNELIEFLKEIVNKTLRGQSLKLKLV